ncbi:uncharacterized protein [Eurosta solidaginis]|uniref:uncharacterized protein n=1 Tax=Eurosta solidaginis TaxID=178769 RepID=UPI0035316FDD
MELRWEDNYVYHIINKVQNAEFIWNHTLPAYKLKYKKQQFWIELVKEMNSIFTPNVPFQYDEVTHKWCNLKSYFSTEKQRIENARRSGASVDEKSPWKLYGSLKFLVVVSQHTPSVNNFNKRSLEVLRQENKDDLDDCIEFLDEDIDAEQFNSASQPLEAIGATDANSSKIVSDVVLSPLANNKKENDANDNASALIAASQNLTNAYCAASKNEKANSFATYIADEISKLAVDLQLSARKDMHNILINLQMEQLNRNGQSD